MGNRVGKVDKTRLILSMRIDMEDTVRNPFQSVGNKQKNFACASFLDIKKQLFPDKRRFYRSDCVGKDFFRNRFTLNGSIDGSQIYPDLSGIVFPKSLRISVDSGMEGEQKRWYTASLAFLL